MVNGLAVLGWGVGGIEAEAAMLGQPISMVIPEVIGFRMSGRLPEGVTATDLVLTVTQMLRKKGVVGKFVEFFGEGLGRLTLEDQATISNMAPEYGATCGFFPVDSDTLAYLSASGRDPDRIALVEAYAKAQRMWRDETTADPEFTDTLELDLSTVEPSIAGPRRPQDRVSLAHAPEGFAAGLAEIRGYKPGSAEANLTSEGGPTPVAFDKTAPVEGADYTLADGHVVRSPPVPTPPIRACWSLPASSPATPTPRV
jgi:aconitate hydratase